uniref:AlNc14C370G11089 protein n=1 Tax=Albugo laibachii Nc14 TaxID=890382 RepID=F0WY44_9STRA|nr:AlNc14C370G11089 [Albugo laibachii Nc14]|eukprot:CCA26394.1 AlNc14C370G11089 [Albugo laibachii Nc14]
MHLKTPSIASLPVQEDLISSLKAFGQVIQYTLPKKIDCLNSPYVHRFHLFSTTNLNAKRLPLVLELYSFVQNDDLIRIKSDEI